MSKVSCEICGTEYDSAVGKCPVCGWSSNAELSVEDADFNTVFLDDLDVGAAPASIPKTEPFQKTAPAKKPVPEKKPAPVKKPEPKVDEEDEDDEDDEEEESGSNVFLVIILVLLILALLGVSAYICWTKILKPRMEGGDGKPQETVSQVETQSTENAATVVAVPEANGDSVPCTGLTPVGSMETLTSIGQYFRLMVKAEPENTTDKIVYSSSNEAVVTIDEYGRVTAVGEGEATIVITCGDQRIETPAVVRLQQETQAAAAATTAATTPAGQATAAPAASTAPTAPTATGTVTAAGVLKLKKTDITFFRCGVYTVLELEGGIAAEDVEWMTSDSSVANVYNGTVTALGRGICIITAEYNGQTAQCIVRCKF